MTFARDHCRLGQAFNNLSPPISDSFNNIDSFFMYYSTNDSTLTLLRNSLFNNYKQKFHCYKKHLKWGDKFMKKVSPIIQCSMHLPHCENSQIKS